MIRTLAALAALLALVALPTPATAQEAPLPPVAAPAPMPPPAGKMQHLRLYLGGAGANQQANGAGGAALLGIQGYTDITPNIQTYWGAELVGLQLGVLLVPLFGGDVGARFTPFTDWLLRPYVRANLGLSFLLFVPVPTGGFAIGFALPIFNTIFLDVAFGARRVFNLFDITQSVDLGQVEISIGF